VKAIRQGETIVLVLTMDEASTLTNCTNETLEALDDWEFDTRVGVSRAAVETIRDGLNQALET
jgi:hypothetical protein